MKIKANIEWVIDDSNLKIKSGSSDTVVIDSDYTEANELAVIESIEYVLEESYGTFLQCSRDASDNGDFVIKNMNEMISEISYDEFLNKTDPGHTER